MGRLTVLQVAPALDAGGAEQAAVEVAAALAQAGHRALAAGEPGRLARPFEEAGGRLIEMPLATKNPLAIWANAARLARLIECESVDVIHARSRAPAWSALIAARRTGRPFVTTYHGIYGEGWAGKRLYNSVMARGDVVIANSAFTAEVVARRYGTSADRIAVIPRGIDPARFDPAGGAPERVAQLRVAWGADQGTKVVLLPGRLTGWKGQEAAIRAVALLSRDVLGPLRLVLAGDSQGREAYRARLMTLAAREGLAEALRIVGHVEDMAAAYLAADVVLSASEKPEAFGRAVVEAAAMGAPVVATDLGAVPETVLAPPRVPESERTGWLVSPGAPGAMAEALGAALSLSPERRAALAVRARNHVLAHFTVARMGAATLEVYDRLAQNRVRQGQTR